MNRQAGLQLPVQFCPRSPTFRRHTRSSGSRAGVMQAPRALLRQSSNTTLYTVKKGDSLIKIARQYDIDWHDIQAANKKFKSVDGKVKYLREESGFRINPNDQLFIPIPTSKVGRRSEMMTLTSTRPAPVSGGPSAGLGVMGSAGVFVGALLVALSLPLGLKANLAIRSRRSKSTPTASTSTSTRDLLDLIATPPPSPESRAAEAENWIANWRAKQAVNPAPAGLSVDQLITALKKQVSFSKKAAVETDTNNPATSLTDLSSDQAAEALKRQISSAEVAEVQNDTDPTISISADLSLNQTAEALKKQTSFAEKAAVEIDVAARVAERAAWIDAWRTKSSGISLLTDSQELKGIKSQLERSYQKSVQTDIDSRVAERSAWIAKWRDQTASEEREMSAKNTSWLSNISRFLTPRRLRKNTPHPR